MRAEIKSIPQLLAYRNDVRAALALSPFSRYEQDEILLALTELGTNLIKHGRGGMISVSLPTEESPMIRIAAQNNRLPAGPVPVRTTCGESPTGGLGIGLGCMARLMDRVEFDPAEGAFSVICEKSVGVRRAS